MRSTVRCCVDRVIPEKPDILNGLPHNIFQELFTGDRNMKQIPLTRGKFATVDDEDYDWLMQWKWFAQPNKKTWYAGRWVSIRGLYDTDPSRFGLPRRIRTTMSRQIMGLCSDDCRVVDHINHKTLDNRRCNLRICTQKQNIWNRQKRTGTKLSQYIGVVKSSKNRWRAMIDNRYLGVFPTEEAAARYYDKTVKESHGEFACLNFPTEESC